MSTSEKTARELAIERREADPKYCLNRYVAHAVRRLGLDADYWEKQAITKALLAAEVIHPTDEQIAAELEAVRERRREAEADFAAANEQADHVARLEELLRLALVELDAIKKERNHV